MTPEPFIQTLQHLPPIYVSLLNLACCYIFMVLMLRCFGAIGLSVYTVVAVIASNLQVLTASTFAGLSSPVALGTVVYTSTFLASDLLTELFSATEARRSVGLGFTANLILLSFMLLTLGHTPLAIHPTSEHAHFNQAHEALRYLFTPHLSILSASLIAYLSSQLIDIYIFSKLKQKMAHRHIWLRLLVSLSAASLLDTFLFSFLAWKFFAPHPVSWHSLLFTYILSAYLIQGLVALFNIPAFYWLCHVAKPKKDS